jgi:hypothetical protein
MSNPIKYSTGTESLALKKGNFYIGTGAVGKGPTSETGYYNGITPPTGGYTIYLNKESNGPSIYTASNDAQLISLTNSIAGQSYTGVQQCFDYFYGQTDKLLVNQDYPADYPYIVMDGLVFNLDAGITQSYPGSGTTWTDVNGLGSKNNGTLTNGPTFSSNDGGSIVFDGTNDIVSLGNDPVFSLGGAGKTFSIGVWFNSTLWNVEWQAIFTKGDSSWRVHRYTNANPPKIAFGSTGLSTLDTFTTTTINTNQWYHIYCIYDGTHKKIYVNGLIDSNVSVTGTLSNSNNTDPVLIGNNSEAGRTTRFFNGNIAVAQIYNRALSATEVLQNYNAQKGRFGL